MPWAEELPWNKARTVWLGRKRKLILPIHPTCKERLGCPQLTPAPAGSDVRARLRADSPCTYAQTHTHSLPLPHTQPAVQRAGLSCPSSPWHGAGAQAQAEGKKVERDVPHPARQLAQRLPLALTHLQTSCEEHPAPLLLLYPPSHAQLQAPPKPCCPLGEGKDGVLGAVGIPSEQPGVTLLPLLPLLDLGHGITLNIGRAAASAATIYREFTRSVHRKSKSRQHLKWHFRNPSKKTRSSENYVQWVIRTKSRVPWLARSPCFNLKCALLRDSHPILMVLCCTNCEKNRARV